MTSGICALNLLILVFAAFWTKKNWSQFCFYNGKLHVCTIVRYTFVQANVVCTTTRTKKVIVGLVLVNLPIIAIPYSLRYVSPSRFFNFVITCYVAVFQGVLPMMVLVINMMLVCEMRRASNAAANLGLQQHQQSQSAVPTIMLVTTSLVYVLIQGMWSCTWLLRLLVYSFSYYSYYYVYYNAYLFTDALLDFAYSYNFYVYLITGKQFRSDLRSLFCRCSYSCSCSCSPPPHSSSSSAAAAHDRNDIRLAERRRADSDVWNVHC